MPVPDTLLLGLQMIPRDRPVALLMRHSIRYPITDPALNYKVGLTPEGIELAVAFGGLLAGQFAPGRLASSPVGRCVDTANAISRGAGWDLLAQSHFLLSHDHIEPAWELLTANQVNGHPPAQVVQTLKFLVDHTENSPSLDIFVTHDTVLGTMVGSLLHCPVQEEHWPVFLEGAFFWQEDETIHILWRGERRSIAHR